MQKPARPRCRVFRRGFLSKYLVMMHFRHVSESGNFAASNYHMPTMYTAVSSSAFHPLGEIPYLGHIFEHTTNTGCIKAFDGVVPDGPIRVSLHQMPRTTFFNLRIITSEANSDNGLTYLWSSVCSLTLEGRPIPNPGGVICLLRAYGLARIRCPAQVFYMFAFQTSFGSQSSYKTYPHHRFGLI